MRSIRHKLFKKCFDELSPSLQDAARVAFDKWKRDPSSVDWHHLSGTRAHFYAADIGYSARAIGLVTQDAKGEPTCVWIFIGTHEKYNNFINIQRQRSTQSYLSQASSLKYNPERDSQPDFGKAMNLQGWREGRENSSESSKPTTKQNMQKKR